MTKKILKDKFGWLLNAERNYPELGGFYDVYNHCVYIRGALILAVALFPPAFQLLDMTGFQHRNRPVYRHQVQADKESPATRTGLHPPVMTYHWQYHPSADLFVRSTRFGKVIPPKSAKCWWL